MAETQDLEELRKKIVGNSYQSNRDLVQLAQAEQTSRLATAVEGVHEELRNLIGTKISIQQVRKWAEEYHVGSGDDPEAPQNT